MHRLFSVFILLFVFPLFFHSCTDIKSEPNISEKDPDAWEMDESLANYLEKFEQDFEEGLNEKRIPGGAVVIVKDGRIVLQKGFGVKNTETSEEVDENTIFRLGSVSKGFASVLTGIFVEQGEVNFDSPVQSYLEDFKLNDSDQTKRIQIKHLLSHTTGLPRHSYTNLVEAGLSLDRIIPRLEEVPLIDKEGEQLSYQNAAFSVIEKVLENQTGTDFKTLLKEEVFDPLSMVNASASLDSIQNGENKALPHIYHSRRRGRVPVPITGKYYNAVSSGGINASISDMGQWLLLLTGNYPEVISDKTLRELYQPITTLNNRRFSRYWEGVNRSYYGMGWRMLENHGQKVVYHGGYVNGYRSEIAFAPGEGIGICILINTGSSYPLEVIPSLFEHFKSDELNDISK